MTFKIYKWTGILIVRIINFEQLSADYANQKFKLNHFVGPLDLSKVKQNLPTSHKYKHANLDKGRGLKDRRSGSATRGWAASPQRGTECQLKQVCGDEAFLLSNECFKK